MTLSDAFFMSVMAYTYRLACGNDLLLDNSLCGFILSNLTYLLGQRTAQPTSQQH